MKRIFAFVLTISISLLVSAQDKLTLANDSISIGDKTYRSDADSVIYLDYCSKINLVGFSSEYQNKKYSIRIEGTKGNVPFSVTSLNAVTNPIVENKQFFVGKDSLKVYINSAFNYIIVPTPKFNTPKDKTILTIYNDSLRIEKGDSVLATFKRGSISTINAPITIDWISLSGIFNKKQHQIRIIQDKAILYENYSIVTEDSCCVEFGKGLVEITVDDEAAFKVDKGSEGESSVKERLHKMWAANWKWIVGILSAIVMFVLLFIFRESKPIKELKSHIQKLRDRFTRTTTKVPAPNPEDQDPVNPSVQSEKEPVNKDINESETEDNELTADSQDVIGTEATEVKETEIISEEHASVSFASIWDGLKEEQRREAIAFISKDQGLKNVSELSVEQIVDLLTEEQKSGIRKVVTKEINLEDEIQKLSADKLIDIISKDQESQLSALYQHTETVVETVHEKVDISKISSAELFTAMTSEQLIGILTKFPERRLVIPHSLWNYIFGQLRNSTNKNVLNSLIKSIFQKDDISEDVWDAVMSRILQDEESTKKISTAITQDQLLKDDKQIMDYVADLVAVTIKDQSSGINLPHVWDDLLKEIIKLSTDNIADVPEDSPKDEKGEGCIPDVLVTPEDTNSTPEGSTSIQQELETAVSRLTTTEEELATTKGKLTTTEEELTTTKGKLTTTEEELTTTKGKLSTTEEELTTTKGKLATTEEELTTTKGKLATTEEELTMTKGKLTTTEEKLTTTKGKLTTTEEELTTTKSKLTTTGQELAATKSKLSKTEQELTRTKSKLSDKEQEFNTFVQKWIDSMKVLRNDFMSIPQELHDKSSSLFTGTNTIISGMVEAIMTDRRSNIEKTIEQGASVNIDKTTTIDDVKSSIRTLILEDLGGKYPGWIDILIRLYAYTKVSFLRDDLLNLGLNINYVENAGERTILLMEKVGIKAVIPELFETKYDSTIYDLEPIRTIDRIIPSVSKYAKSGIVADIYRIGYVIENGENKKPIVSIY